MYNMCNEKKRYIYINKNYSSRVLKKNFIFFQKYPYFCIKFTKRKILRYGKEEIETYSIRKKKGRNISIKFTK